MPAEAVERRLTTILAADIARYRHSFGALLLTGVVALLFAVNPAFSANYSQCMAQAIGMSGDARQKFMGSCLSHKPAEMKTRNCANGKPCGKSCIARDKVCRKWRTISSLRAIQVLQAADGVRD